MEKYCKLKEKNSNAKQVKNNRDYRKQREELDEQRRKEGKENFLRKITNGSGIQSSTAIQNIRHLHHSACNFMDYKDYKIDLKLHFIASIINQLKVPRLHLFFCL